MHSAHTVDGGLTPAQLATAARAAGLDFVATTGHNTADEHSAWRAYAHDAADPAPDLLVILGQEVVTRTGHWLALGLPAGQAVDWRYGVRDGVIDAQKARVHESGALCVAAHPHAPYASGVFMYPYDGFDLVEVWNGPWTSGQPWQADNEAAVAEWGRNLGAEVHDGRWRPAMGNSDLHFEGQFGTHTVVLADALTTEAVLAGLRAGRSWVAGSSTMALSVTARSGDRTAGVGDRLSTDGEPVQVSVAVSGVPGGVLSFHTERGTVHRESFGRSADIRWDTSAAESAFVRVEVRHTDATMAALSNPIILA